MSSTIAYLSTVVIYSSRRDTNGNVYRAFSFIDHVTGKQVTGLIDTLSAAASAPMVLGHEPEQIIVHEQVMTKREFKRTVDGFKYAGCSSKEVGNFIKENLK